MGNFHRKKEKKKEENNFLKQIVVIEACVFPGSALLGLYFITTMETRPAARLSAQIPCLSGNASITHPAHTEVGKIQCAQVLQLMGKQFLEIPSFAIRGTPFFCSHVPKQSQR